MKEKFKHLKEIPNMMLLALLVLLFILTAPTSAMAQTLCDGKVPTIVGTEGPDEINGTEGPDVIHGLGGNDIIRGLGGDDVICGGDGMDIIGGGCGNDTVLGGNGNDSTWGGYGNDAVRGDDGNDSIYGGPGNDVLRGNHGNDSLYGKSGADELYGGWGTENNDSCYDDQGTFIWGCEQFNGEYIPPAPVPKTGQTYSYEPGDDGDLQRGVPWPDPRFTDNGDGTVTDNLTGLIWLKNASCFGNMTWNEALDVSNNLADGQCGLTDGSIPGAWRLPNVRELYSLIDSSVLIDDQHFTCGKRTAWSSTSQGYIPSYGGHAYLVSFPVGYVGTCHKPDTVGLVKPVRGGN